VPGPLGGHELRRAEHQVGAGDHAVALDGGDAEVGQHHPVVVGQQHVRRLDVAVPYPGPVRRHQGGQDLQADLGGAARFQRALGGHHLLQRAGRHVLHDDPGAAVGLEDVVHLDHMGVAQPGRGAGLAQRAPLHRVPLAGHQLRWQDDLLDRDVAVERLVAGEPDFAHAAPAERVAQPVAAGEQGGCGGHDFRCTRSERVPLIDRRSPGGTGRSLLG
jgi:hypothetical protein